MQNRKKKLAKNKNKEYAILPDKDTYINTYRDLTQRTLESAFTTERHNTDSEDEANA
jgi:hypothetical protein